MSVQDVVSAQEGRRLWAESLRSSWRQGKAIRGKSGNRPGRAPDLGTTWYRSTWERNCMRVLRVLQARGVVLSATYEPTTFRFTPQPDRRVNGVRRPLRGVRQGVVLYRPDFRVQWADGRDPCVTYWEVRGYMSPQNKTALRRMALYYPDVTIELIDRTAYRTLEKQFRALIPEWE